MEKLKFSKNEKEKEFYDNLKKKVDSYLLSKKIKSGPDFSFWLKAVFWFISCWGTYIFILTNDLPKELAFILYIFANISGLLFGFSIGHDASHKVISKNSTLNYILHSISFVSVGIDPTLWGLRHVRSHHLYPNIEGSDIDIDKNPLIRLSPTHPWKKRHRFQYLYAPFAYALALIHSVFWGDWVYLIHKDYDWMRRGINPTKLWASFIGFKIAHFSLMIILPYLILPFSFYTILAFYLFSGSVISLIFIVMLVGTHFFTEADYLVAPPDKKLEHSWAVHNLRTSCDWNPDSAFSRFISGGANCHAAHHLFPNICHTHYKHLTPLIRQATAEYGITYHCMSLTQMMFSHFRHLKNMANKNLK